jgi:hypothetical protein
MILPCPLAEDDFLALDFFAGYAQCDSFIIPFRFHRPVAAMPSFMIEKAIMGEA